MIVGVMGVVIEDGGVIVVVINVGFDAIRSFARGCGDFVRGRVRILFVARGEGNATSSA